MHLRFAPLFLCQEFEPKIFQNSSTRALCGVVEAAELNTYFIRIAK